VNAAPLFAANHLWQSTFFAAVAGLMPLALRRWRGPMGCAPKVNQHAPIISNVANARNPPVTGPNKASAKCASTPIVKAPPAGSAFSPPVNRRSRKPTCLLSLHISRSKSTIWTMTSRRKCRKLGLIFRARAEAGPSTGISASARPSWGRP